MRRAVATAVMSTLAACGAFSGSDATVLDAGATDAATSDAVAASSDGGPLGIPAADGGASDSGDSGPMCPTLLNVSFDGSDYPAGWSVAGDMFGKVSLDSTHTKSPAYALHATVSDQGIGGSGELVSPQSAIHDPSSVTLRYSMYVMDWTDSAVTAGCLLTFGQSGNGAQQVRLVHHHDKIFYGEIAGSSTGTLPITGLFVSEGYYDVKVVVTGFSTGTISAMFTIARPDGSVTSQAVAQSLVLTGPTDTVTLHCGLSSVDFTGVTPHTIDTWIDDVTLSACP